LRTDKVDWPYRNVPGYMPDFIASRLMSQEHKRRNIKSVDAWIEDGIIFAGTPDTVCSQIERFTRHVGGFQHLLVMGQSGDMTHEEVTRSVRLLATEVAPRLKELCPATLSQ
jgi:alkanesulfonate monooxygenase SsuD/methylene tetrahydromethanopterin reductase-like flavin-dependent oxidoreductase (luciferase family)